MTDRLIAGFPAETWERFRRPIDKALVSKDPKGMDYVKHQVCIEMLNECFGPDGWWQEIVQTWFQPQYEWGEGTKVRIGRAYAEAHVKLYIGAPGAEPVCRENIGSQVAGGDWSETRKGAVSEALKRAASLFGWAANVYKTEAFASHENGNGGNGNGRAARLETPAGDITAAQYQPDGRPANAAAERHAQGYSLAPAAEEKLLTLMDALEMADSERAEAWATVTSRENAVALKADLERQLAQKREAVA
jgi:hypothetical protein